MAAILFIIGEVAVLLLPLLLVPLSHYAERRIQAECCRPALRVLHKGFHHVDKKARHAA